MRIEKKLEQQSKPVIIGDYSEISSIVATVDVDRIVVALDERRGRFPVNELLDCRMKGLKIEDGVAFTEYLTGKLSVENLRPSFLIFSDGFKISVLSKLIKRTVDILASLFGLIFFFPLSLIIALCIKLDSEGPVFYSQERVGEGGRTFRLLKLRSMVADAEKVGPTWAKVNDKRITRVGRIIRKLRLDELPQLANVLKGEMSLVGPRPERPFFIRELEKEIPYYSRRHAVKPGVTGWAQICYPYGASKGDALEKLKYDLYYMKHISLFLDLMIIFETVKIVLLGKGGR